MWSRINIYESIESLIFVIDYYILVDKDCILGRETTTPQTISLINTSDTVTATFTSVVVNVEKVV
jgi:hypothetical protein